MRDPDVVFAGYKIPHPLEYVMLVSVQTTPNSNPIKAFHTALVSLQREFETLKRSFVVCNHPLFFFMCISSRAATTENRTNSKTRACTTIDLCSPFSQRISSCVIAHTLPPRFNASSTHLQKENSMKHCQDEEEVLDAPFRLRDASEGLAEGGTGG